MSQNDSSSGSSEESEPSDRRSTGESTDRGSSASADDPANGSASAGGSADTDDLSNDSADAEPSVPEGFGEVPPDREASRWGGYALAVLLAVVFLLGLVRLTYPNASILVVATLLALFGLLVGFAAVWTRIRGS